MRAFHTLISVDPPEIMDKGRRKKIAEVSVLPSNCLLQNFKEEKQTMQANINLLFEPKFAISLLLEPAILISFDDKISPSPSHC